MMLGGDGATTDVSLFFPATNATCRGPDLPDDRLYHTAGEMTTYNSLSPSCVSPCRPAV